MALPRCAKVQRLGIDICFTDNFIHAQSFLFYRLIAAFRALP